MTAAMSPADLTIAVAVGGALLLIAAGVGQLRHRPVLRAALRAQALLPRRLRGAVEALTPVAELVIGLGVLVALAVAVAAPGPAAGGPAETSAGWAPRAFPVWAALIAQTVLYGGFAGYLWMVRRRRPAAPCGCFTGGGRVTPLVIARAALFAVGSLTAASVVTGRTTATASTTVALVWLAGGFVAAMLGWLLPALTDR